MTIRDMRLRSSLQLENDNLRIENETLRSQVAELTGSLEAS